MRDLGEIWGHKSVSIKNKIYIYGGYINGGLASKMSVKSSEIPNENVYALDIGNFERENIVLNEKYRKDEVGEASRMF